MVAIQGFLPGVPHPSRDADNVQSIGCGSPARAQDCKDMGNIWEYVVANMSLSLTYQSGAQS